MTTQELAKFIFDHRVACLASGEGGLVDPVTDLDTRQRLILEEWALGQAEELKTQEAYIERQAAAREKLKSMVNERRQAEAQAGIHQGLEMQAQLEAGKRLRKMLN